ncbi:uncharacterized protein [Palaemon carinicauda]|uniref:uncharacterized protein n=1 Tax=Palaemon carinicauda TaxID=392227 RepID=UPI0035B59394
MAPYIITVLQFIYIILARVIHTKGEHYDALNNCVASPVDFAPELVKGRATISLPSALLQLSVSVEMDYIERDGIAVLRLTPVIKDEKKCVDYPTGNMKLCYEFSEVHWGRTNEEGSDHSVGGYLKLSPEGCSAVRS